MQARIPLFSAPAIKNLDYGTPESITSVLLDLSEDADQDVTRLVTLYALFRQTTPDSDYALLQCHLVDLSQSPADVYLVQAASLRDDYAGPQLILDQFPIRGNVSLHATATFDPALVGGRVTIFGFYTVAESIPSRERSSFVDTAYDTFGFRIPDGSGKFNVLDKRPLQPEGTVPEAAALPVEAIAVGTPVPVHVVPDGPYIDEVSLQVSFADSTEVALYFEDYPDNSIIFLTFGGSVPSDYSGMDRILDGIPFLGGEGRLMFTATTGPDLDIATVSGFFVRY